MIGRSPPASSMLAPRAGPTTGDCRSSRNGTRPPRRALPLSTLHRELNALKKTDVPWMYSVSKCAPQEALWNLDAAFTALLPPVCPQEAGEVERQARVSPVQDQEEGTGQFPAHRQDCGLGRRRSCCRAWGGCGSKSGGICRPVWVQILSATVSEQAGHWYVSLQVEEEQAVPENTGPVVGIDLGIKNLATLSDGEVIANPRHLKRRLKKLKRLQRVVSRRQKGGKNRKKAVRKLAKLHRQIKNQRQQHPASGHHQAGENQVGAGDRRPECQRAC